MLSKDIKTDSDRVLSLVEYLASFWNHEAVKKIQEARESSDEHNFQDDESFEKSILERDWQNNPLVDAIRKINTNSKENSVRSSKSKGPVDLSTLSRFVKDDI